jgi:hypothetical protein
MFILALLSKNSLQGIQAWVNAECLGTLETPSCILGASAALIFEMCAGSAKVLNTTVTFMAWVPLLAADH